MARSKPTYTECRIFYDGVVNAGDFLKSNGGSVYLVQSVRQDKKRKRRRHLVCLRWPADEIPADAVVRSLIWYPRKKKSATTLAKYSQRRAA